MTGKPEDISKLGAELEPSAIANLTAVLAMQGVPYNGLGDEAHAGIEIGIAQGIRVAFEHITERLEELGDVQTPMGDVLARLYDEIRSDNVLTHARSPRSV